MLCLAFDVQANVIVCINGVSTYIKASGKTVKTVFPGSGGGRFVLLLTCKRTSLCAQNDASTWRRCLSGLCVCQHGHQSGTQRECIYLHESRAQQTHTHTHTHTYLRARDTHALTPPPRCSMPISPNISDWLETGQGQPPPLPPPTLRGCGAHTEHRFSAFRCRKYVVNQCLESGG